MICICSAQKYIAYLADAFETKISFTVKSFIAQNIHRCRCNCLRHILLFVSCCVMILDDLAVNTTNTKNMNQSNVTICIEIYFIFATCFGLSLGPSSSNHVIEKCNMYPY
jgi:hypothetical protein